MLGKLTIITQSIKSLLETITTGNGYSVNFGSINSIDSAQAEFPYAEITYSSEFPVTDAPNYYAWAEANFIIRIFGELSQVPEVPFFDIDEELDTILRDVKKCLMRAEYPANVLPLDDDIVIRYNGFDKIDDNASSMFRGKHLETRWTVRYYEDINT